MTKKMDEQTLREVVASLFEDTPDAVVLYDREGQVICTNESAQMLVGYAAPEIIGTSFREHINPVDYERVYVAIKTALVGGTDHFDTSVRHKDGTIIPVEVYVYPARLRDEIIGIFAQARDIMALRSAEEALTINQEKFRSLFEYHPDGVIELKGTGSISRVNVALESETGFYGEQVLGKPWTELVAPEHRAQADEALREALRGEATELDSLLLDRLGNRIDVQLKLVPLHVGDEIRGAYAIFKNVTAQKTAERAIATQSEQIRRLYLVAASRDESIDRQIDSTLSLGLELFGFDCGYVTRFDGDRLHIRNSIGDDHAIPKGTIYPMNAALSRHLRGDRTFLAIPDMDAPEWHDDPARATAAWRSYFAIQIVVEDQPYGALVFASHATRAEGFDQRERDLIQLMGLFVAAGLERAKHNERIELMAFNDSLTGLPNRVLFADRIEHTLATAKRYNRGFAVMYFDLDRFKEINDRYGHPVGDAVLIEVANRLRSTTRESDTVARFGGDEFVILQPIVDGPVDSADLARKLNTAMQMPIIVDDMAHTVHASLGIAIYPSDASTIDELMEAADQALYRAKREGRNRWCFANQESARRGIKQRPASS